jgi:hypothetical protein
LQINHFIFFVKLVINLNVLEQKKTAKTNSLF